MVTATVRDSCGNLAPDGTSVQFATTQGTLDRDIGDHRRRHRPGAPDQRLHRRRRRSSRATAFVGSAGGATGQTRVEFTTDRELLFTRADARWIQVECPQYLIYSADTHVIEAQGHQGSVRFRYKALSIVADALQLEPADADPTCPKCRGSARPPHAARRPPALRPDGRHRHRRRRRRRPGRPDASPWTAPAWTPCRCWTAGRIIIPRTTSTASPTCPPAA